MVSVELWNCGTMDGEGGRDAINWRERERDDGSGDTRSRKEFAEI